MARVGFRKDLPKADTCNVMGWRENDTVYTSARGDVFYVSGMKVSA